VSGLLRAELLRLRSRRTTWLLAFLTLALMLSILIGMFVSHRKQATPEEIANARLGYEQTVEYCNQHPADCGGQLPVLSDFLEDKRFHLTDTPDIVAGFSVALVVVAFVLACSFLGSEWHHSLMGALLLWEPRRGRVLLAKALAVSAVAAAAAYVANMLMVAGLYLVAATRGTDEGVRAGFLGGLNATAGRASLLVAIAALIGVGLASLTRSSAASIGIGLVYLGVIERFLAALKPGWRPWLAGDLASAVLLGTWQVYVPVSPAEAARMGGGFGDFLKPVTLTWQRGALVLGGYLAVLLILAFLDFRRRDVT
jgi:ABC-2 type transport system permease protein